MAEARQFILLAIAVLVPVFLIMTGRERGLLAWVCFTVGINIFDTSIIVNLPAARIAGLMLIPRALQSLPAMSRALPGRALVVQYACLVLLGLVFGFISPWPDDGLIRAFNQVAPGRAVIYLIRTAADISLAFFVARQVMKWKRPDKVLGYILAGTSAAALAAVLEYTTRIDWYGMITGLRALELEYRMRGFNYEPRGLGLMTAQGMLLAVLFFSRRRRLQSGILIVLNALGLFLSGSISALVAAAAGAAAFLLLGRRARPAMAGLILAAALAVTVLLASQADYVLAFKDSSAYRLTTARYSELPENIFEELAFRMEVFDGPALLFLVAHPIYLITGTGPGLITLPASAYLSSSAAFSWLADTGINSPPTMGGLLEVANAGLAGLTCWAIICLASLHAFNRLAQGHPLEREMWQNAQGAFIIGAAAYFVQTSPLSAIWPVFMGTGIGAACLARAPRPAPVVKQTSAPYSRP